MYLLSLSVSILVGLLIAPIVALALLLRPRLRIGLRERLGGVEPVEAGAIWVHGSSVGEALAAAGLIAELERRGIRVVASVTTRTGLEALARVMPELTRFYAPLDHPVCVARALSRVRPRALVLVETELWPSWIAGAKRRGIPVFVASGRISDRSFPRYRLARFLLAPALGSLDAVGARSKLDAERFSALGVPAERVSVTGDLKLEPPERRGKLADELDQALSGEVPIFIAGSTHEGEEAAALAVLGACEALALPLRLVVAPRHRERCAEVAARVGAGGRTLLRRGELTGEVLGAGQVLLLDSVGELGDLYARAAGAFVGGTLAPIGGHNLLEPVFVGCPVFYGPHVEEVRGLAELAVASGAGREVPDVDSLIGEVTSLLRHTEDATSRGEAGMRFLKAKRGSAARAADLIESRLERGE